MFARTEVAMPHPSPIFSCSLAPPWRLTQLSATLPRVLTPNMKPRLIKSRSEEHTSELQSPCNLVCRLLLEKKKTTHRPHAQWGRFEYPALLPRALADHAHTGSAGRLLSGRLLLVSLTHLNCSQTACQYKHR